MIDVRTMLVVLALTNVAMAGLYWMAFGGRFRDGLAKWTLSFGVQGMTWLLFALRGYAPDILTVMLANALLMLVWPLQGAALLEFQGRRLPSWALWSPPVVTGVAVELLLPDFRLRVIAVSLLAAASALVLAVLFFRERTAASARVRLMMTAGYICACLLFIVRGIGVWLRPDSIVSAVTVSPAMSLVYVVGFLIILMTSFGMLLMHKERADQALVRQATVDALTGAYNRGPFAEFAERELARAQRSGTPVSLMMLDVDRFKSINDGYGHPAGDQVLRHFAGRVNHCLRKGDLLVRYGGEEFCVLLPGIAAEGATNIAERIRSEVASSPIRIGESDIRITVSIGITTDHDGERTLDTLISRADEALYRAKTGGRNRIVAVNHPEDAPAADPGAAI
jgi:diguanylate cyclase (GGDEF)-like protein